MINQKQARLANQLRIGNAGSKKVPIILIGSARTRSGKKFRNAHSAPANFPANLPVYNPTASNQLSPAQAAAEAIAAMDQEPVTAKSWNYNATTGWYQRVYWT